MNRPLYKQVTDNILNQIRSGDINVGDRLPPEEEYAEQLGISRSTLRLAFTQLEQSGIIKRRKRGGTEIIALTPVPRFSLVGGGVYDLLSMSSKTELVVSDVGEVKGGDIEHLANCYAQSETWLAIKGCRFATDQAMPISVAQFYVPEYYSDISVTPGTRIGTICAMIEDRYNISAGRVKQWVAPKLCPEESARLLGLEEGEPILSVLVNIEDTQGRIIEAVCSHFDPSRVEFYSDIKVGD